MPDDRTICRFSHSGQRGVPRALNILETVRNHVSSIYRKLHVYDRLGAVLYAIREGLVDMDGLEGE